MTFNNGFILGASTSATLILTCVLIVWLVAAISEKLAHSKARKASQAAIADAEQRARQAAEQRDRQARDEKRRAAEAEETRLTALVQQPTVATVNGVEPHPRPRRAAGSRPAP